MKPETRNQKLKTNSKSEIGNWHLLKLSYFELVSVLALQASDFNGMEIFL